MNVITYNAAYSLYPHSTFERRETLVLECTTDAAKDALRKYAGRGWRILSNSKDVTCLFTGSRRPCAHQFYTDVPRFVCDNMSWTIPLDITGVNAAPPPSPSSQILKSDPVSECGWKLSEEYIGTDDSKSRTTYEDIESTIFRWHYTSPEKRHIETLAEFMSSKESLQRTTGNISLRKNEKDAADTMIW